MGDVLLIGDLKFVDPEWSSLSSEPGVSALHEYRTGSRDDFLSKLSSGTYGNIVALYRSNDSTKVTGPFDEELISKLPSSLRYICHSGAGYDNIDVAAATRRGIQVSSTPQAVDNATADTAVLCMLGALRLANVGMDILRRGRWGQEPLPTAHDPQGKVLGILGMGSIGRNFAAKARAFGMTIQYHNRSRLAPEAEEGARYVSFEELLRTSDVLSLNLNLSKATEHIIGKDQLAMMKKGVTIVNTARGKLMDEAALVEALNDGDRIWSVGLDVFEEEPKVHPGLIDNPRVFLLPHIGTLTFETRRAMEMLVIDNIKSALTTGKLITRVKEQDNMDGAK
ncbi:D-isomer specific 2-hydroxyacid dehydrogenase [Emericellopsis atlantica]|uniref:D-isomer specific 2-hydroxyacid dehydrogenase n=1 Tax=Emericellopsis atlantica TaxID=2614577 RepID=A0A9P8CMD9_9HYPO|nr:D-isomer specific 2-hydroxyacid dehydrogenase [Emericellopsis atlantica]KAG9250591.1 D-isomer specific 2-hydroxyacid dehydrogenase [Emericellopsis atlantica]